MLDDGRVDAGQRPPHRAGLDVEGRRVGDHDAAGLGLPPVVVDRQAQHFLAPAHRLGVERLADAGDEAQVWKLILARNLGAGLHQHADRRRRRVPDRDARVLQDAIPALGVEFLAVDDRGHAVQQRRDDAVGGACHPARVGGAPEDVVGMQVERIAGGGVMGDGRAMHMHGALGGAGGAAGEVQQRHVFGRGRDRCAGVARGIHQRGEVERARGNGRSTFFPHQQHMFQGRHPVAPLRQLALVKRGGGDQYAACAQIHARGDGLGTEGGKQGRHHRAMPETAEHGDVKLGDAAREHKDPLALGDAELRQHIGEALAQSGQFAITDIMRGRVERQEAQCHLPAQAARRMRIDCRMGDIEATSRQAGQLGTCRLPRKPGPLGCIVSPVRHRPQIVSSFANHRCGIHMHTPLFEI